MWPHGKNCYTFVCWFKLDLKSAGRRPMSPDTAVGEERYTLYRYVNIWSVLDSVKLKVKVNLKELSMPQ